MRFEPFIILPIYICIHIHIFIYVYTYIYIFIFFTVCISKMQGGLVCKVEGSKDPRDSRRSCAGISDLGGWGLGFRFRVGGLGFRV